MGYAENLHSRVFVSFAVFCSAMGFGIIVPVMPALLKSVGVVDIGEAAVIGGMLILVFAALQFIMSPLIGSLSDKFGRKKLLLIAIAGVSVDHFIVAMASDVWWLFIGRGLAGAFGASFALAHSVVADTTPHKKRAAGFGVLGLAEGIGLLAGPVLGGFLGELGPRAPFLFAGVLSMVCFVVGVFLFQETLPTSKRQGRKIAEYLPFVASVRLLRSRYLVRLLIALFMLQIGLQVLPSVWAYFTVEKLHWSARQIGLSVATYGLMLAIVQGGLVSKFVSWYGEGTTVVVGLVIGCAALTGIAFSNSAAQIYFCLVVGALGGLAFPSLKALFSQRVSEKAQGEVHGVIGSTMSLTMMLGPPLMTTTFTAYTGKDAAIYFPGAPFLIAGICLLLSLAVFASGEVLAREPKTS